MPADDEVAGCSHSRGAAATNDPAASVLKLRNSLSSPQRGSPNSRRQLGLPRWGERPKHRNVKTDAAG